MTSDYVVRALREADAERLAALRRFALSEAPLSFESSPEDPDSVSVERWRRSLAQPDLHAIFGGLQGPELVAMVGLLRSSKIKSRHRVTVVGMFVHPDHRRRGLGERLLRAAIDHARTWEGVERLGLGVSETTPAARRLYERLGFGIWGTEPDALRYAGRSYAEHYLSLELR